VLSRASTGLPRRSAGRAPQTKPGAVAVLKRRCSPDPHSPLRLALETCLKRERLLSSSRRRQQAYSTITTAPWPKPNRAALGNMRTTPQTGACILVSTAAARPSKHELVREHARMETSYSPSLMERCRLTGGRQSVGRRPARIATGPAGAGMAARLSRLEFRIQAAAAVPTIAPRAVCHCAVVASVLGARLHRHGTRAFHQSRGRGGRARVLGARARGRTDGDRALAGYAPRRLLHDYRRDVRRALDPKFVRTRPQATGLHLVSRTDRARAARLERAGGKPRLPPAACLDVRRPGALLDLPRARDRGYGILSDRRCR